MDITIEDGDLELNCERSQSTEHEVQEFVTRLDVKANNAAEMEKSINYGKDSVLTELVKDKLINTLRVGYDAPEKA